MINVPLGTCCLRMPCVCSVHHCGNSIRAIRVEIRWYAFIWTLNLLLVSLLLFTFVLYFFQPETNVNRRWNVIVLATRKNKNNHFRYLRLYYILL